MSLRTYTNQTLTFQLVKTDECIEDLEELLEELTEDFDEGIIAIFNKYKLYIEDFHSNCPTYMEYDGYKVDSDIPYLIYRTGVFLNATEITPYSSPSYTPGWGGDPGEDGSVDEYEVLDGLNDDCPIDEDLIRDIQIFVSTVSSNKLNFKSITVKTDDVDISDWWDD